MGPNRRSLLLLAVLGVALTGLGWFALGGRAGRGDLDAARDAESVTSGRAGDTALEAADGPAGSEGPRAVEPQREEAPEAVAASDVAEAPEPKLLTVRIVDELRRPVAGIATQWCFAVDAQPRSLGGPGGKSAARGILHPAGAAEMLRCRFPEHYGGEPAQRVSRLGLVARLPLLGLDPLDSSLILWIETPPDPEDVIELVLPPHGRIRFTWDDSTAHGGKPIPVSVLRLCVLNQRPIRKFRPKNGARHVLTGPVALEQMFAVELSNARIAVPLGSLHAAGPTQSGETKTIQVPLGRAAEDLVQLSGSLVDEKGEPLGDALAALRFERPKGRGGPFQCTIRSNADGEWSELVPRALASYGMTCIWRGSFPSRRPATLAAPRLAPGASEHDLGEITLPIHPSLVWHPIVAGVVVDQDGRPRDDTSLTIAVEEWGRSERTGKMRWLLRRTQEVDAGTFEIGHRGSQTWGACRVYASRKGGKASEAVEFSPGAEGVRLVLPFGKVAEVEFLTDPWVRADFVLSLKVGESGGRRKLAPKGPTRVEFDPAEQAPHVLSLHLTGTEWLLWEGSVERSSSLGVVDLRGRIALQHFTVRGPDGALPLDARVRVLDSATGAVVRMALPPEANGAFDVLVPSDAGDLVFECKGVGSAVVPTQVTRNHGSTSRAAPHQVTLAP